MSTLEDLSNNMERTCSKSKNSTMIKTHKKTQQQKQTTAFKSKRTTWIRPLAAATCSGESLSWPVVSSSTVGSSSTMVSTTSNSPLASAGNKPWSSCCCTQLSLWPISSITTSRGERWPETAPRAASHGGDVEVCLVRLWGW